MLTIICIIINYICGLIWGIREYYHKDPRVFEKALGVDEESFFGSKAWKRQYVNNDPNNKHKPEIFNSFRDFWHASSKLIYLFVISSVYLAMSVNLSSLMGASAFIAGILVFPLGASISFRLLDDEVKTLKN